MVVDRSAEDRFRQVVVSSQCESSGGSDLSPVDQEGQAPAVAGFGLLADGDEEGRVIRTLSTVTVFSTFHTLLFRTPLSVFLRQRQ